MAMSRAILLLPILFLTVASPAVAQAGTQIPEASSLTLFALGVAGVLLGRRLAQKRSDRDD